LGAPSKDSENGVFFCPPEKLFGEQMFGGGGAIFSGGSTKKQKVVKDFIVALDIWAAGRVTDTVCVTSHYL